MFVASSGNERYGRTSSIPGVITAGSCFSDWPDLDRHQATPGCLHHDGCLGFGQYWYTFCYADNAVVLSSITRGAFYNMFGLSFERCAARSITTGREYEGTIFPPMGKMASMHRSINVISNITSTTRISVTPICVQTWRFLIWTSRGAKPATDIARFVTVQSLDIGSAWTHFIHYCRRYELVTKFRTASVSTGHVLRAWHTWLDQLLWVLYLSLSRKTRSHPAIHRGLHLYCNWLAQTSLSQYTKLHCNLY